MTVARKTWVYADRWSIAPGGPSVKLRQAIVNPTDFDRGHPMVTEPVGSAHQVDYFRTSGARYFQWRNGFTPATFSNYGYIPHGTNMVDIYAQPANAKYVGFKFESLDHDYGPAGSTTSNILEVSPFYYNLVAPLSTKVTRMFGNGNIWAPALAEGQQVWEAQPYYYNPHTPYSSVTSAFPAMTPDRCLREKVFIEIRGLASAWETVGWEVGVSDVFAVLNPPDLEGAGVTEEEEGPLPSWIMWHNYVLGSADPRLYYTWYGQQHAAGQLAIPGLFGTRTMNGTFYDHYFESNEIPETAATTQVSAQYTYYASWYQAFSASVMPLEVLIPNYYTVMTLAKNSNNEWAYANPEVASGPTPVSLYDAPGGGELPGGIDVVHEVLSFYGKIGTDVVSQDGSLFGTQDGAPLGIPLGLISAGGQNPDSVLSRFARTNFSLLTGSALADVVNFNKHIGLSARLVRGPNSILSQMTAENNTELIPYGLHLNLTALPQSEFLKSFAFGGDLYYQNGMADYFLYEIMKANILNYTNVDPATATTTAGAKYPTYHTMSFSAKELTTEMLPNPSTPSGLPLVPNPVTNFYGFDWTGYAGAQTNFPWANNPDPQADVLGKSTLRAINFNHLILQWGLYPTLPYGTDNITSGLIGQTQQTFVAEKLGTGNGGRSGFIVGRPLIESPVPGSTAMENQEGWYTAMHSNLGTTLAPPQALVDMGEFFTENLRSYQQIMEGEPAYNDIIAYRVDKHSVDSTGNESSVIQSFYFPAVMSDQDFGNLTFFDSQVFYNTQYKYKIYAYQLVVGNQYNYTNAQVFPTQVGRYPSRLAPIMGFDEVNYRTVPTDYDDNDTPGTNQALGQAGIYLAQNEVRFVLPPGETTAVDGPRYTLAGAEGGPGDFLPFPFEGNRNEGYLDDSGYKIQVSSNDFKMEYNCYLDARRGSTQDSIDHAYELDNLTFAENGYISPQSLMQAFHDATPSNYIMRLLLNPDDPLKGKFLIARREVLQQLSREEKENVLFELGSMNGYTNLMGWLTQGGDGHLDVRTMALQVGFDVVGVFNAFFLESPPEETNSAISFQSNTIDQFSGLNATIGLADPAVLRRLTLRFETGIHGLAPQLSPTSDDGTARFDVNNFSSIKIIEMPYSITNAPAVHDLPPMPPNADFYPIRNNSSKIKILINQNNFRYSSVPITIEASDEPKFLSMYQTQNRVIGSAILFGADDTDVRFQVFRKEGTPPESYLDFQGLMKREVESRTIEGASITSAAFIDTIEPNINYYYCFRTVDIGGWISNPTGIIRVQLVDDNGRIYPIIESYDLKDLTPIVTEKPLKKYLEIGASLEETIVIPDNPTAPTAGDPFGIPTDVVVGQQGSVMQDSTNRSFKIRLTSKDTGKKIDLNITFNVDMTANPNLVEEN